MVFGLLEWPRPEPTDLWCLRRCRWRRRRSPRSSSSSAVCQDRCCRSASSGPGRLLLANVLTLLLYGALGTVLWLVPLNLIQVQHYTATAAGAALLPLPILMFLLSRWSGGLVARVGSRLPLTIGPVVAAMGLLCTRDQASAARTGRRSFRRGGARIRNVDCRGAADDDRNDRGRDAACRRGIRSQQCGGACCGSDRDRGVRDRAGADLQRTRRSGARSTRTCPPRHGRP